VTSFLGGLLAAMVHSAPCYWYLKVDTSHQLYSSCTSTTVAQYCISTSIYNNQLQWTHVIYHKLDSAQGTTVSNRRLLCLLTTAAGQQQLLSSRFLPNKFRELVQILAIFHSVSDDHDSGTVYFFTYMTLTWPFFSTVGHSRCRFSAANCCA